MSKNLWQVRNVDQEIRKKIRLYALQNNLNVAEALKELVEAALAPNPKRSEQDIARDVLSGRAEITHIVVGKKKIKLGQ